MKHIRIGIAFAAIAVILGALGAHALESVLEANKLDSFLTGVRYQMYHAFALIGLGLYGMYTKTKTAVPGTLFTLGVLLFSVSIYGLTFLPLWNMPYRWLGPITPIGGLLLIAGWISWLWITFKKNESSGSSVTID
jgi:uncharacterized membrane protein YgdD (TMEM256/DUF423 family)